MDFADKTLTCADCGSPFTFTSNEQQFYAERGFTNEPTRCKDCRDTRKSGRDGGGHGGRRAGMEERGEPVGSGVDDSKARVDLLPCATRSQPRLTDEGVTWRKVVKPVVRLVPVG